MNGVGKMVDFVKKTTTTFIHGVNSKVCMCLKLTVVRDIIIHHRDIIIHTVA